MPPQEPAFVRAPASPQAPTRMVFYEWHWASLGDYMTPRVLKRCISVGDSESLEYLKRVRPEIMVKMLDRLDQHIVNFMVTNPSLDAVRNFWERGWILQEGFIPGLIPDHVITTRRFGFKQNGRWVEWNTVSAGVLRFYWASMFAGLNHYCQSRLRETGSKLFQTLPGPHCVCRTCHWSCPESEMSGSLCSYCDETGRFPYSQLTILKGVPSISVNETRYVKTECQLIRSLQNISIKS